VWGVGVCAVWGVCICVLCNASVCVWWGQQERGEEEGRFQIMGPTTTCMYSFHDILTDFRMGTTVLLVMLSISRD